MSSVDEAKSSATLTHLNAADSSPIEKNPLFARIPSKTTRFFTTGALFAIPLLARLIPV